RSNSRLQCRCRTLVSTSLAQHHSQRISNYVNGKSSLCINDDSRLYAKLPIKQTLPRHYQGRVDCVCMSVRKEVCFEIRNLELLVDYWAF
ncbi:hypothetical protein LINPERPRIM_LOCUS32957, partial [Linum perenne]